MKALAFLLPLVPLLPLAAAGTNAALRAASVLISGGLLAAAFAAGVVSLPAALAQTPLWAIAAVLSFLIGRPPRDAGDLSETELEENRRQRNELKNAVTEAEKQEASALQIYGTAKALAESLSWEEMHPRLTSAVQRHFGSYDFLLYAVEGLAPSLILRRGTWKKEPPFDAPAEAALRRPPDTAELIPVLSVPIRSGGEHGDRSGVLFVRVQEPEREAEILATAEELGRQLGMALNKALLFRQLETQSRTDGLTGILRRQAFIERLTEEFKRASVFKTQFSVLMIDVDHFKSVNDTHGHAAGDAVLARIGKVLMESFYETDVVGRYGGEEFIVLLPRSELEGVKRKAEALRARLQAERIPAGFKSLQVTVSIGIARYPESGGTAEAVIEAADKALYEAKATGRNRVAMR